MTSYTLPERHPAVDHMRRARNILAASLIILLLSAILMAAALTTEKGPIGPFTTDVSILNPDQLAHFQQAASQHRDNTASSITMRLPADNPNSQALQPLLESRGWRFYHHWGTPSAAIPVSDHPLLPALAQGPQALRLAAAGHQAPPPDDPLTNHSVSLTGPSFSNLSPLFIAATATFTIWAILCVIATWTYLKG